MAGALTYYATQRPIDKELLIPFTFLPEILAIEMSFDFPIGINHPETNEELTYCGRYDLLAQDENGVIWVVDEKTTGSLGPKWGNQWDLEGQITGYVWGARKLLDSIGLKDSKIGGAIINGIAIKKYDYEVVQCKTLRQDWEVDRWFEQMRKDVMEWKTAFNNQNHNQVFNHICAMYNNPCEFAKLCKSRNPDRIFSSYEIKFWSPLERG